MTETYRPFKGAARGSRYLVPFGLVLLLLALTACGDKSNRTYNPVDPPTVLGEWEGTILFIERPGSDSTVTGPQDTYFVFDDSTFTYTNYDSAGFVDPRYGGTAGYDLTSTTIYLHETTFLPGADYRLVPYGQGPHDLNLGHQTMVMTRIEDYGPGAETEQRIELQRVN